MYLKHLKVMVAMQLKNKVDLSYLKDKKKTINKIVYSILTYALIIGFAYLLFSLSISYNLFSLIRFVPTSVLTVLFTFMFILSTLACMFGLIKSLYFSKDNIVLLTFPVPTNMVFLSKLVLFYIYELKRSSMFLLPVFIAYGIINSFSALYFVWLIFAFIFVSALPVLIGALLSIPVMFVVKFLKQFKFLELILLLTALSTFFYFAYSAIALIPEKLSIIGAWGSIFWRLQDFLTQFTQTFLVFDKLVLMLVGNISSATQTLFTAEVFTIFGIVIGLIIVLFTSVFLLTRPLFFKMSSKNFEFKIKTEKKKMLNKAKNRFVSPILKEVLVNFRNSSVLYQSLSIMVMMPILIFLLNKLYFALNISLTGVNMTLAFNLLITLLVLLSSNNYVASIYSKDGASSYLIKTQPMPYHFSLVSKLIIPAFFSLISTILITLVLSTAPQFTPIISTLFFFIVFFVCMAHLLWSAEFDIMNPQNSAYASTGEGFNNPNENKASFLAFGLAFIFFAVSMFLLNEGQTLAWVKIMCVALVLLLFKIYMFYMKIKVYYKEL